MKLSEWMRALALAVVAATLVSRPVPAQENYSLWSGLRAYSLNTSTTGAAVAATVTNFPVLVRLGAADSAVFAAARPGGIDLRFTKENGVRLPHQIESWDATSRAAAIWVKADTVRGSTSMQVVRMHWGKADAADSSRAAAVFDTAHGFVGVWHMAGSGDAPDATANGLNALAPLVGIPPGAVPTGAVGPARSFDGVAQHFVVLDAASLRIADQITMSLWVNATNWNGSTRLLQKSPPEDNNSSQYGLRDDSNDMLALNLNGNHTNTGAIAASPPTGTWTLVHGTFDGSTATQYQDGLPLASGTVAGPINTGAGDLNIARRPDGTSFLTGMLDEVRLHKVARSAAWVRLEYENQKPGQTLVQLASQVVDIRAEAPPRKGSGSIGVTRLPHGLAFSFPRAESGTTRLSLTDLHGRILWNRELPSGRDEFTWNGRDQDGRTVSAGLYVLRARSTDASGNTVSSSARIPYAP